MGISPAEVRLRRLLAASPQQKNQMKLMHNVTAMRENLAALTGETGPDDIPLISAVKAEEYAKKIDDIADTIDTSVTSLDLWESLRKSEHGKSSTEVSSGGFELKVDEEEPLLAPTSPTLRRRRMQRGKQEPGKEQGGGVKLDAATNQLVDKHRQIQDALIGEMAIYSEQMKNNSLMMEKSLKDTERVLDRTQEAVEHSLSATNRANLRAGLIYKSTWKTGCFTWVMLFLMCVVFFLMVALIRFTG